LVPFSLSVFLLNNAHTHTLIIHEVIPLYEDGRGKVADLKDFFVEGLHLVELKAGSVRGNHVHQKDEVLCVIGGTGRCEIIAEDQISGKEQHLIVEGDLKTYRIRAGLKHTIKNFSREPFYLVCFFEASVNNC